MRPLLRELAAPIRQVVEKLATIRTEPGEQYVVVRRAEDVDVVELEHRQTPERAADVGAVNPAGKTRSVEALRGQRDAPRLACGQRRRCHRISPSATTEHRSGVRRSATSVAGSSSVAPQRVAIQLNVAVS